MKSIVLSIVIMFTVILISKAEQNHNTLPGYLPAWYEKPEARIRILPPPENENKENGDEQKTEKTNSTKPQDQQGTKQHMLIFDAGASV